MEREKKDEKDFELVLAVFNKRGYSKGSRSIHMTRLTKNIDDLIQELNIIQNSLNVFIMLYYHIHNDENIRGSKFRSIYFRCSFSF
ncbi:hypothetical protein TP70_05370 [Staphylococcus microti]|uniref:Uncharacterized protein n=2 Tax=Staphylococcus microti TaxID=569857 RepID=A0A0D6XSU6_9STAP|nr:hypothetical protein TP70_05370 [Staphylococcus microti]PNZ79879.1 hypothetical protein CD132_09590 [Staphylococcus microti]SUM58521.1 Uncharacterised protein [Staphylococcus microti]